MLFIQLQCTHHVNNWGVDIQQGVYEMLELFIDFVAACLSSLPTPVKLLETLAIIFDPESVFQRKHRSKSYDRSLYDKQLGDRALANPPSLLTFSVYTRNETHGWLCQLINRFVYKDGIIHLKKQFEKPLKARVRKTKTSTYYQSLNSLLSIRITMHYLYHLFIAWIISY